MIRRKKIRLTRVAGGIIVNKRGRVAVVQQGTGAWSLPKGKMEPGEDAISAAIREIREETSITKLKLVRKLGSYRRFKVGKDIGTEIKTERRIITMFLFTTPQMRIEPQDPENPDAKWFRPEKAVKMLTHPKDKQFLLKHLKLVKKLIKK
jgi:8-oxo-dGTP pyrophosphatase MutT (NUDIX family)